MKLDTPSTELVNAYLREIAKGYGVPISQLGIGDDEDGDDGGDGGVKVSLSSIIAV